MRAITVVAAGLMVAFGDAAAGATSTERCSAVRSDSLILGVRDRAAFDALVGAARDPGSNPDLYRRLREPTSVHPGLFRDWFAIFYPETEDIHQIAREVQGDPVLREAGVTSAGPNGYGGFPAPLPFREVVEFFNSATGHYFLSSSVEETSAIERGAAGAGWQRTGEGFRAVDFDGYFHDDILRVNRLYAPTGNTHFFTVDAGECGAIRKPGMGWIHEGTAFWAHLPANGTCPAKAPTPVYRAYNNRWMFGDSNHRFTVDVEVYRQMIDRGWIGEGVAMCIRTN